MQKNEKTSLILHIPHASVYIPDEDRKSFCIPDLRSELLKMTDLFTDELFGGPYAALLFPVSRLVCDPERFRDDTMEPMARVGMGAVYTRSSDGTPLRLVSEEDRQRILRTYYDPHHSALTEMTKNALLETGRCLIIDGHSFSPVPLPHEPDKRRPRPDFCIGTDDFHTPRALFNEAYRFITERGYSVSENVPFSGALVPMRYYRTEAKVQSIMIEVNRGLYMTPDGRRSDGFERTRETVISLLDVLEHTQTI